MGSGYVTTKDDTQIFYKDWGPKTAQPIVFHHGWPLSADDWDNQMLLFLAQGYRVIAHDRRGHGRSTQTDTGNDMDTYAADLAALTTHLNLKNAIHVGHSTGGRRRSRMFFGRPPNNSRKTLGTRSRRSWSSTRSRPAWLYSASAATPLATVSYA
jgi:hypothetical protein